MTESMMMPGVPGRTRPPDSRDGGHGGLLGSQAAVVMTSQQESREAGHTGNKAQGELGGYRTPDAAKGLTQEKGGLDVEVLEDKTPYSVVARRKGGRRGRTGPLGLEQREPPEILAAGPPGTYGSDEEEEVSQRNKTLHNRQEGESSGNDLDIVRSYLRTARGETDGRREEPGNARRQEIRVGDWTCKTEACRGWSNFKWRTMCLKCGKSPAGAQVRQGEQAETVPGQSPRERYRKRQEEEKEPIRRPQRMIIITINTMIDNKSRVRPQNKRPHRNLEASRPEPKGGDRDSSKARIPRGITDTWGSQWGRGPEGDPQGSQQQDNHHKY